MNHQAIYFAWKSAKADFRYTTQQAEHHSEEGIDSGNSLIFFSPLLRGVNHHMNLCDDLGGVISIKTTKNA